MPERNWNKEQLEAITAFGGNLLVSAAAGSGKTAVLVERVIRMLTREENPVDADRILAVTFTNLAAAEMKTRINAALTELIEQRPNDERLRRQQLLMERAHIATISSFCLDIVRENFSVLGLSPDFRAMDEQEKSAVSAAAMEEVLEDAYSKNDRYFEELAETLGAGRDDSALEEAVLKLYDYIRSMPQYRDWLAEKAAMYDPKIPVGETPWGEIIAERAKTVLRHCLAEAKYTEHFCAEHDAQAYRATISSDISLFQSLLRLCESGSWDRLRNGIANAKFDSIPRSNTVPENDKAISEEVKAAREAYKKPVNDKKSELRKLFDVDEKGFGEDIADLYPKVRRLFELVMDYDRVFAEKKRERKVLDFPDMEQFALTILAERDGGKNFIPTPAAKDVAARFDYILVDECQDINKAQDTIFSVISRGNNLFFVGDVKQSIYRFRQAMPELFLEKRREWPVFDGEHFPATIILDKNYRSRKSVAGAVNFIFGQIMSEEAAEIEYGSEEMLHAEAPYPEDGTVRNEAILIDCGDDDKARAEAAFVAKKIYDMVRGGTLITDHGEARSLAYSDICILLRSMKGRADIFIEELRKLGINCRSDRGEDLFSRPEVLAVLDVLRAADNPLLDIPTAGAMLCEMFAFTPDELAEIRAKNRSVPLCSAVKQAADGGDKKAAGFIAALSDLRRAAAAEGADSVIERLYRLTAYPQMMRALPDGEVRLGNLRLLEKQAADLEAIGVHGLPAFLRAVDRIAASSEKSRAAGYTGFGGNCVSLLSVHGSKGLEFPVVFLCGTDKPFNNSAREAVLLHPELGFACKRSDEYGIRFSTVPCEAIKLEQKRLNLAEEMRILYVALTRAKERIIITYCGKDVEKSVAVLGKNVYNSGRRIDPFYVSSAKCEADWIFSALLRHPDAAELRFMANLPESAVLRDDTRWKISKAKPAEQTEEAPEEAEAEAPRAEADTAVFETLAANAEWRYPFAAAEKIPVKAGVSELTHGEMHKKLLFSAAPQSGALSGAARGTALHTFMQFCDFENARLNPNEELRRLTELKFLTEKQAETVSTEKVRAFFESELYERIERSPSVKRELRFVQSLPAAELGYENAAGDDKITVQGVADCVFEEDGKLFILDYKTDFVESLEELRERYAAQLNMYKRLISVSVAQRVAGAVIWSFHFGKEIWV